MRAFEAFLAGALVLIGLYLVLSSQQTGSVISSIAGGFGGIFKTLQGRG